MISSIGISVSGLQAASLRQANHANNIANQHTTSRREGGEVVQEPYVPQDVVQSNIEPQGGVRAELQPRDPASIPLPNATHPHADENGLVDYPNVSTDEELVGSQVATYDYKANLKAIKTADEMLENLLDITS